MLDNLTVILHRPAIPENIGAVARVMLNTGCRNLILSNPDTRDWATAGKLAVAAAPLLEEAPRTDSLDEALALAGTGYIVGTTGRDRKYWDPLPLTEAAGEVTKRLRREPVTLVFGPEDTGLSNEELTLCHLVVTIPSSGDLASFNLSHAAAIVLFQLMMAGTPHPVAAGSAAPGFDEIEGMYGHLRELLTEVGFLLQDNPDHMMRAVRSFINRAEPTEAEVRMVRGICRRLLHHLRNR